MNESSWGGFLEVVRLGGSGVVTIKCSYGKLVGNVAGQATSLPCGFGKSLEFDERFTQNHIRMPTTIRCSLIGSPSARRRSAVPENARSHT